MDFQTINLQLFSGLKTKKNIKFLLALILYFYSLTFGKILRTLITQLSTLWSFYTTLHWKVNICLLFKFKVSGCRHLYLSCQQGGE